MAALAGYGGRVVINGTTLKAKSWSVRFHADPLDVTNFESSGEAEYIGGVIDGDFSFDADWFSEDNPFTSPINLVPRQALTNVKFFQDRTDVNNCWLLSAALVTEVSSATDVRGVVHYSCTLKPQSETGAITMPVL